MRIPDPREFAWTHLGRHLIGPGTGDVAVDIAQALSQNYPHVLSDTERLENSLRAIRSGRSADTIGTWATKAANAQAGHEMLAGESLRGEEDVEARRALAAACAKVSKPRASMGPLRLTTAMMAVIREDAPSLLVASIVPAAPQALEFRRCGERPYMSYKRDFIQKPPNGVFAVLEFDKVPYRPDDIVLNLSPRQIRTSAGVVDRRRVLDALALIGTVEWSIIDKLSVLVRRRDRADGDLAFLDREIDKLWDGVAADVDDVIDALPRRGTADWNMLRILSMPSDDVKETET